MSSKTTIIFFCFVILLSVSLEVNLKKTSTRMKSTLKKTKENYTVYYYGDCDSGCPSGTYCAEDICVKNLNGAKGSYCGRPNWTMRIECKDGLGCDDHICVDNSKSYSITYIRKY